MDGNGTLAAAAGTQTRPSAVLLAIPLVLTALAVAAQVLDSPLPLELASTLAMAAAWGGVLLYTLHRYALSPRALAEHNAVMSEMRTFLGREIVGAREELDRSRRLMREAVAQLHSSFSSMEEQSRQQSAMITCLVEQDGAGSPGVRAFTDAAGTLMGDLTQSLANESREGERTVQVIAEMVRQFDEVFEVLRELKGISDQAGALSGQAVQPNIADARSALRAFGYDMRQLTSRATGLYDRIDALVSSARVIVDRVRVRVEQATQRGIVISSQANARAEELVGQIVAINRSLADGINLVSQCSLKIRRAVGDSVRSLQFEDITGQAMSAATAHVDRLRALNQDAEQLQQALAAMQASVSEHDRQLEAFAALLRAKRSEWRRPAHKPVSQLTMSPGSVELF